LGDSVRDSVRDSVWSSVRSSVRSSVNDSVWSSVRDSVWSSVWDSVRDSGYGQHDASWLAFCYFFNVECGLKTQTNKLSGLWKICQNAGWFLPHEKICWISERHNVLHRNKQGKLHNENGISLAYPDGWGIWALNGVRVSEQIVMTPAEYLDPTMILSEKNAEIRREIVRKIGIERVCAKLNAKVLDRKDDYELLEICVDGRTFQYLKMKNPSIGVYHVEGVRDCKSVSEALHYRKPEAMKKIPVSENGAEWHQQGDICFWPKGAQFLKPAPSTLT
jgi:hypothetical protein